MKAKSIKGKAVFEKIFRPFLPTKPTGQGKVLELSYDIVKANGGEIKVETNEAGTVFIIQLPL